MNKHIFFMALCNFICVDRAYACEGGNRAGLLAMPAKDIALKYIYCIQQQNKINEVEWKIVGEEQMEPRDALGMHPSWVKRTLDGQYTRYYFSKLEYADGSAESMPPVPVALQSRKVVISKLPIYKGDIVEYKGIE